MYIFRVSTCMISRSPPRAILDPSCRCIIVITSLGATHSACHVATLEYPWNGPRATLEPSQAISELSQNGFGQAHDCLWTAYAVLDSPKAALSKIKTISVWAYHRIMNTFVSYLLCRSRMWQGRIACCCCAKRFDYGIVQR